MNLRPLSRFARPAGVNRPISMLTTINYFAYGSNMSPARLLARTPSAHWIGSCHLPRHQLRFHKIGADGSAKCDALSTRHDDDEVLGVLYQLSVADLKVLDRVEGLGIGYDRRSVTVFDARGKQCEAFTYFATAIDPSLRPFDWYLRHVVNGARAASLPAGYIEEIAATEAIHDPDPKRRALELALYTDAPGPR